MSFLKFYFKKVRERKNVKLQNAKILLSLVVVVVLLLLVLLLF